jgi:hypothetical protein
LLLAAGFEEGVRGEQLRLERAIGTTTPDVIYRAPGAGNEGICIYLDGLSDHLHGNPATAEQDARIRAWLRNNEYEVIEIPANDLSDASAMLRHFRKLAGYLGSVDHREKLRTDSTWFSDWLDEDVDDEKSVLRIVDPKPDERYVRCVPLVPLKAAAGYFGDPQYVPDEGFEWVEVNTRHKLRPGMFVAQVVGKSMEPKIPDGAYCLFRAPVEGTRVGLTVLVQLRDAVDPETGERYTVKVYTRDEDRKDEESDRSEKIVLKPRNKAFEEWALPFDPDNVRVIAEFIEVVRAE